MTIQDTFMIGDALETLQTMEEIGILYDPDASFRPYAIADLLGDGSLEGNGYPSATWHFNGMAPGDADILYAYIGTGLSIPIFVRTRLNRLNETATDYAWATFSGFMNWTAGEEQVPALHTLDITISFTRLVPIPD